MPFYFRKSVSAGPFRFNLSSGGVGVSVGVKGLRIGTGPRGHYVHAGRGGLYYRAALGGGRESRGRGHSTTTQATTPPGHRPPPRSHEPNVEMVAVSSASVLDMTDERHGELLDELNAKQNAMSSMVPLGGVAGAVALLATIAGGSTGAAGGAILVAIALFVGSRLDAHRGSAVVLYDLEADAAEAYESLTKAFDDLAASSMKVGKETLYWLPDVLLVVESGKVGAVAYDMLEVQWQDSRFIEEEALPRDAQVVGQTWKHPNKSGGPDRRFANNRQLPICLYESIHLHSRNGLNELLQVSTNGRARALASAARRLGSVLGAREQAAALPAL